MKLYKYPALLRYYYAAFCNNFPSFVHLLFKEMLRFVQVTVLVLKICITVRCTSSAYLTEYYEKYEIIPDVLEEAPNSLLKVVYNGKFLEFGNEFTPTEVKDVPSVHWNADSLSFYTLIMNEPDAPSRQDRSLGECLHWLVCNIPGNDIKKGETIVEYLGSGPPKGNELHRYVFSVYEQSSRLNIKENYIGPYQLEGRLHWKQRNFTNQYSLKNLTAGNMYLCQYDDYVPVLLEKIGIKFLNSSNKV